jgi:hypothetical protein
VANYDTQKVLKYCVRNGVLVVLDDSNTVLYLDRVNERDEAEDRMLELCEQGVLCPEAKLVEEKLFTGLVIA